MGSVWARRRNRCVRGRRRGLRGGVLCVKGGLKERVGGVLKGVDESQILCLLCEKCSIWME